MVVATTGNPASMAATIVAATIVAAKAKSQRLRANSQHLTPNTQQLIDLQAKNRQVVIRIGSIAVLLHLGTQKFHYLLR